jgi:DNA-binding NarL/FixJ family response regulator
MIFAGYIAGPQKTILQPLGNPFRILLVGLATRHILDVLRICQNYRELSLENNENDSYAGESNPFPDTGNALFRLKKSGGLGMLSVRVLLVEDVVVFRRVISSILGKRRDLQIVGEVADGLEMVRKAQELQPDLILLDIGLPVLNGIEAARQIRRLAPESKILFLGQGSSADVVQEALSFGALGYVVKAQAGSDLLAAVDAVSLGKQFVSAIANYDAPSRANFAPAPEHDTIDPSSV